MDIAQLGLEIRSDGVVVATKRLGDFASAGSHAENVTSSLIRMATRAGAALAGAFGISALAGYADKWSDLQSQVGAAIKDMDAAGALMGRLGAMARASYSPLDKTVTTYARNASVLRDLGKNADQAADFSEALNHALVTTATKGQDADVVLNALSRSISTGKLRAMEYETIMSRSPRVLEAVAEAMGTTVTGLRQLAVDGKVTGNVIVDGLISSLEELRKEAAEMPATLGDAGTIWRNTITEIVGRMDQATNASGSLAEKLIEMADAVRAGAEGFIQFAVTVSENFERMVYWAGAYVAMMGVNYVTAMGLAAAATTAKAIALRGLRLAIAGTGIGALAIILGDVTMKLWDAATATDDLGTSIEKVGAPANALFNTLKNGSDAVGATFSALTDGIAAGFMSMFATVYTNYANFVNLIRGGLRAVGLADRLGISGPEGDMDAAWGVKTSNELSAKASASAELAAHLWARTFGARVPELVDVDGIVGGLTGKTFGSVEDMWSGLRGPKATTQTTPLSKEAQKQIDAYKGLVRGAHEFIASQQLEAQALGMTAEAASRMRHEQDLLNKAANDNIKLSPAMRNELMGLAAQMAAVEEATRRVTELYNFGKDVFSGFFNDLKSGLKEGESFWEALGNAGMNALDKIAQKAMDMALSGIWDMIFGAVMGGIGGGMGGGWGIAGGFGKPGIFGIPGMADGGTVGRAGLSWVGERGPELLRLPQGAQVIPNGPSMAMAANQNQSNDNQRGDVHITINGSGLSEAQLGRAIAQGLQEYDAALAPKVEAKFRTMQSDPRAADGGW